MKIFISVDNEGVAGVVSWQEGQPGNAEYERSRYLMTLEANAAIAGAFEGGASEVLVNDSHGPMVNILPDLLDERAELIRGNIKPMGMFAGLDASYAGAMCVGYHAAGAEYGVLAHTTSLALASVRLNGQTASEAMIYGAYAGSLGVPVILLSGDDVTERSCGALFPGARFVCVKTALGQRSARSLSPGLARERLRAAAAAAVRDAAAIAPYRVAEPCRIAFELSNVAQAELCGFVPGAERVDARTVAFTGATIVDAVRWMIVCAHLAQRAPAP